MSNLLEPTLTDLFGETITPSSLFVIINSNNILDFITKLSKNKTSSIWEYNRNNIDNLLIQHKLNPNKYLALGNVLYLPKHPPKRLILAHHSICKNPSYLKKIEKYGNGYIYKPMFKNNNDNDKYVPLGYYFGNSVNMPNINSIGLLNIDHVVEMTSPIRLNEFNLLNTLKEPVYTIKRSLFYNNNPSISLSSPNNKILTKIDDNAHLKDKKYSSNQSVTYNAQGELMVENKCLSYENKPNPDLFFDDCNGDPNQKWYIYQDQISSQSKYDKCITENNDTVSLDTCDSINSKQWNIENGDVANPTDYVWDTYEGKNVVLVESDNPWYINKNTTIPKEVIKVENELNKTRYKPYGGAKSNYILDKSKPDLGLGHSYKSRLGYACQKIENFDGEKINDWNYIILIMIVVMILLAFRKWKQI